VQFAGAKKKKPLKGLLSMAAWFFTRCIAYFINHCWNDLLVLYLESLDLPLKTVVEGSTNLHFPDDTSYIAFSAQKLYQP
jgi:hypothetical protein